ncbi:hypothetical protein Dshi_3239 [Dinoroseobacter shibae DFL 12 = DSM 16493]|jgi:hypothetical protein|uniref:Uncharacterized protein n=1 Tax=Dinoroseobacter shibae (strain DSM 16493 / NCIMB 14021 / DFL 12) TaxID=398580 RepID=A8LMP7_DINSH|nr:hypothetical protein [Dinoroseobacter shibae]ABV94972.1 hypothetical protein Dshi_3239 [Dinoroseobacter shibae DFL 12 = DSM 16493]URF46391.1 relaxase/mobilization nuclease domain-containing protein [Dinoroseobacter shibae]URF50697.1 relaxase/mobilization nuclease domain-containing protein [Dinoroseobacter shibae]
MADTRIEIRLPDPLRTAAETVASAEDISLGQLIRDALRAEIARRNRKHAKTPTRADERLLAPLRVLLANDLAEARGWEELQNRLRAKGYSLQEAGGGLALHSWPDGARQCKGSDLGYSYATLMRRFGQPFPSHSHRWPAERVMRRAEQDMPSARPGR